MYMDHSPLAAWITLHPRSSWAAGTAFRQTHAHGGMSDAVAVAEAQECSQEVTL